MTRLTPLLERHKQFARSYTPIPLRPPTAGVVVLTCLDHRVDPAIVLGLRLGDAPVIRNAGGRVTQAVIDDLAYLAFLAQQMFGGQGGADPLFEVAIVHHTQCGTGRLADPSFRHLAAEATGVAEAVLEASAVSDPYASVETDVERLLAAPQLSRKVSVSGHVYDVSTGRVATAVDARFPSSRPLVEAVPLRAGLSVLRAQLALASSPGTPVRAEPRPLTQIRRDHQPLIARSW